MPKCGEESALMMSTNCVIRAIREKLRAVPAPESHANPFALLH